jgi:hypothetical protein
VNAGLELANLADPQSDDTDGDKIKDSKESDYASALAGIEGDVPSITHFDVDKGYEWKDMSGGWCTVPWKELKIWVRVWVDAEDVAGINKIYVKVSGMGKESSDTQYTDSFYKKFSFTLDFDSVISEVWSGWDVEVQVTDNNGNTGKDKKHIDSVIQMLVNAFIEAYKAMIEAAKQWVIDRIKAMFKQIIKGMEATRDQVMSDPTVIDKLQLLSQKGSEATEEDVKTLLLAMSDTGYGIYFKMFDSPFEFALPIIKLGIISCDNIEVWLKDIIIEISGMDPSEFTSESVSSSSSGSLGQLYIEVDWTPGCKPLTDEDVLHIRILLGTLAVISIVIGVLAALSIIGLPVAGIAFVIAAYLIAHILLIRSPVGELERYFESRGIHVTIDLDDEITDSDLKDGQFDDNDRRKCKERHFTTSRIGTYVYAVFIAWLSDNLFAGGVAHPDYGCYITTQGITWLFHGVCMGHLIITNEFYHDVGHCIGMEHCGDLTCFMYPHTHPIQYYYCDKNWNEKDLTSPWPTT